MKAIIQFFLSLKTAFWLFLSFIVIMFVGSLSLPNNLAFFSGIDETPLFIWLASVGAFRITWWIYALIGMLALLAISTIFCTSEALIKRLGRQQFLSKLSPQVMHIGVLFIMLGHLLTASMGFKSDVLIKKGESRVVAGTAILSLLDVRVWKDKNGYDEDWEAKFQWREKQGEQQDAAIRPARPHYFGNFGFTIKSVTTGADASALIRVCRDPGALWALFGGVLLCGGGVGFLYGRFGE